MISSQGMEKRVSHFLPENLCDSFLNRFHQTRTKLYEIASIENAWISVNEDNRPVSEKKLTMDLLGI
jgi:hypothetical protein